jgi:hypothetical protein
LRLDLVYLLRPEPEPVRPTRRAVLGWYAAATLTGGVVGYFVAGELGKREEPSIRPEAVAGREHRWVAWARALADSRTPDADLLAGWTVFLQTLHSHAPDDPELWLGVQRLAILAVENRVGAVDRRALAQRLVTTIASNHPPAELGLDRLVARLQELAR